MTQGITLYPHYNRSFRDHSSVACVAVKLYSYWKKCYGRIRIIKMTSTIPRARITLENMLTNPVRILTARSIIGDKVFNDEGEDLGKVVDIMLNMDDGKD